MKFKSFEELECLLSNAEKEAYYEWKNCKEVLAQRPSYMQTQHRILPYLPSWMKKNVIDVRELFNCNNTSYGTRLLWNHVLTLSLGKTHEVTFAILDDKYCLEQMEKVIRKVAEVYRDLKRLYKAYGHSMTLVSMQTEDFGMYLPPSFYDGSFNDNEMSVGTRDAAHLTVSIKEMIHGLSQRRESMMDYAEESAIEFLAEADEYKACRFKLWYERHLSNLLARTDKACELLGKSGNNYYVMPVWNCIDIFMCDYRRWGREFCVKLDLEESLQNVDDLNRVRPLIDDIVRKTETEDFAFGVKKKGTDVQVSDRVTTVNNYAIALSSHEN